VSERKKVLIAGASSGIGAATARRFAREGWDVCLNARRARELGEVLASLAPGHHLQVVGDASDPALGTTIQDTIRAAWGRLDALVNSVALFLAGPDASYITGQVIVVDGGLTVTF